MKLGSVTLPPDATIDSPDLTGRAAVVVDYDVAGQAVFFLSPRQGGQPLAIDVGLTDHLTAKQLAAMQGSQQTLELDDRNLAVVVLKVAAKPVRDYPSYQDDDPYLVTIDLVTVQ